MNDMAEHQTEFVYRKFELYKSESLGSGSYGGVCKAKCDGLLCAAKIMHPTLFDLRDPGTVSYLQKFQEECRLLSLARHPNVVQYLATYSDPETRLPVLLMELCDECLTKFLERSPGPLPYHTELNISHDIALALVYLHSNGLIHRDLTGNNVLMIAGPRAKITDFGMSKLSSVNPRMTAFTLCPGNVLYMSPEALDEPPTYTDKLDAFSFGVLQIQILTRQFPNPTERFQLIDDPRYPDRIRMPVPETQRRQTHLQLISDTHPLKPLALQCLKNKERERPSAQQLSERMSELKLSPQYTESTESVGREERAEVLQQQIGEQATLNIHLVQQLKGQKFPIEANERDVQERALQQKIQQLVSEFQQTLQQKDRTISDLQQRNKKKIQQLVSEFQQSLQQKDNTISDLQQTISAHERKLQQLEQQGTASDGRPQNVYASLTAADTPQEATESSTSPKNSVALKWGEGKKAPERMCRGAATVCMTTGIAYFNPCGSHKIYSYRSTEVDEPWCKLVDSPHSDFSLAIVDGLLTIVGGYKSSTNGFIDTLLSLTTEDGEMKQWREVFPHMCTKRSMTAALGTGQALVVAGGFNDRDGRLKTVEVMDIRARLWTTASMRASLPYPFSMMSGAICGDRLYLAGGFNRPSNPSKSVLTCRLADVLSPPPDCNQTEIWKEIEGLPVASSTLATLSGRLLAIGGHNTESCTNIHSYDERSDSWCTVSHFNMRRSQCLVAVLPGDRLLLVGGYSRFAKTDSVEVAESLV